jgi:hypothetical protein
VADEADGGRPDLAARCVPLAQRSKLATASSVDWPLTPLVWAGRPLPLLRPSLFSAAVPSLPFPFPIRIRVPAACAYSERRVQMAHHRRRRGWPQLSRLLTEPATHLCGLFGLTAARPLRPTRPITRVPSLHVGALSVLFPSVRCSAPHDSLAPRSAPPAVGRLGRPPPSAPPAPLPPLSSRRCLSSATRSAAIGSDRDGHLARGPVAQRRVGPRHSHCGPSAGCSRHSDADQSDAAAVPSPAAHRLHRHAIVGTFGCLRRGEVAIALRVSCGWLSAASSVRRLELQIRRPAAPLVVVAQSAMGRHVAALGGTDGIWDDEFAAATRRANRRRSSGSWTTGAPTPTASKGRGGVSSSGRPLAGGGNTERRGGGDLGGPC